MILEICVDSLDSAITAARGGADRIELCSDLLEGGITPSAGLIQTVRKHLDIEVYVMIRPRGGDFVYTENELQVMEADLREVARLGADGVVLGALSQAGNIDLANTRRLVTAAKPMKVTFHRAIDMAIDPLQACEDVIATGAHRILTSGGCQKAMEGAPTIAQMAKITAGRIAMMVGSGINASTVKAIAQETGAQEFHASLRKAESSPSHFRNEKLALGTQAGIEYVRYSLREEDVVALRTALDALDPRPVSN